MDTDEKLRTALDALRKINTFTHVPDCNSGAPVHECGCPPQMEREIAAAALRQMGEEENP